MPLQLRSVILLALTIGLMPALQSARGDVNPKSQLKKHIRDVVQQVKAAPTAEKKRAILDEELNTMISALNRAENMSTLSTQDEKGIDKLRAQLQAKLNELHGTNGYEAVPNSQLDTFADYIQQDFERADSITISLTTALLIILLIVLLA